MSSNIYLLLGMENGASLGEVKRAYARLMERLGLDNQSDASAMREPLQKARAILSESFERLKNPEIRKAYEAAFEQEPGGEALFCRPKIGQLLVAAGLLTLKQLDAALEIQHNTGNAHVPLGQILVACGYITAQQLDYYLRQQMVMKLPADHPQRWGQRLVELGLVTEDQLKVALIEQKTTGCTLRQALINRGWLAAEVLDRIF